jgi:glycosyltransferase involved in cell wall biosynthesis
MGRQVDRVVAVSAAGSRELLQHAFLPRRRVSTCPNGVDASFWNRDEEAGRRFRRLYGICEEAYLFGVVGRLVPLKCVDLAIRALALIPPRPAPAPTLCIVGDGPDRARLEQLADELGIGQRVCFTGSLEDLRGAYSAMGTLLCTSSSESCPLVLSEAMACGCRVLAPPVGGIPELLGHAVCGALVDSRAAADWATEMQGHACTPALERWAIARAVRAYIVGAHDQRMRFADLERLMSQVVPLHD